jgi:hypothetical protein
MVINQMSLWGREALDVSVQALFNINFYRIWTGLVEGMDKG